MSVRIIGGKWRGRKARFADNPAIRPTPDRVRETLFNWLMQDIAGSRCLDLFSGSGALGLEALSRSAAHVTFVDSHTGSCRAIMENLRTFGADASTHDVQNQDVHHWLKSADGNLDIIFMDPPFADDEWLKTLKALAKSRISAAWLYLETPREVSETDLPAGWSIHRAKKAGAVHFSLCRCG